MVATVSTSPYPWGPKAETESGWQNMFTQAWCSDIAIHNLKIHNLKSEKYNQLGVTSLPPLGHSLLNWPPSKSWRLGDRNHFLAASAWAAKSASFWAARNRARSFWKAASSSELRLQVQRNKQWVRGRSRVGAHSTHVTISEPLPAPDAPAPICVCVSRLVVSDTLRL